MQRDFVTPSTAKCVFSFVERKKKEKKIVFRICFRIRLRECVGTESLLLTGLRELKLLKVKRPETTA